MVTYLHEGYKATDVLLGMRFGAAPGSNTKVR